MQRAPLKGEGRFNSSTDSRLILSIKLMVQQQSQRYTVRTSEHMSVEIETRQGQGNRYLGLNNRACGPIVNVVSTGLSLIRQIRQQTTHRHCVREKEHITVGYESVYSLFGISLNIDLGLVVFYRYIVPYSNNILSSSIEPLYVISDLWYNIQMHD